MSARRVAFYMHDLSGGGVERMRLALIAALRARGAEVTLLVGRMEGALVELLPPDLPVVTLGGRGTVQTILPLAKAVRRLRPDVLVSSLNHNNIAAILAAHLAHCGTKTVICQHNALSAEVRLGWKYRVIPWLYWALQPGIDGIVAVSEGVAKDLATTTAIRRNRITHIYNPVIGDDFPNRLLGGAPHPWLETGSAPAFIFVGRLTEQKNPALVLKAFALVNRTLCTRLIMLGEGPLRLELEKMARDLGVEADVAFVGFQVNPIPWIARARCLVLSSSYEGLGNVLIEALACGTPVVATDCPHGPREILDGGAFGELVPVDDAPRLAAAMVRSVSRATEHASLSARASAFTAAACADAHLTLFDKLDAPRRGGRHTLGLALSPLSARAIADQVLSQKSVNGVRLIVTPNIDHVRLLRRPAFAAAYASAELVCPDGFPVLLYARLRGFALRRRVTGCELFQLLADHPTLSSKSIVFVVESEATQAAVLRWAHGRGIGLMRAFVAPLCLANDPAAQAMLAAEIRAAEPDILVMTLGAPLSETFVHHHSAILAPCWALCVGQAVRVYLRLVPRAPIAWQNCGMEWLWRLAQEPRRLARRYSEALAWFPMAVLLDLLGAAKLWPGSRHSAQLGQEEPLA